MAGRPLAHFAQNMLNERMASSSATQKPKAMKSPKPRNSTLSPMSKGFPGLGKEGMVDSDVDPDGSTAPKRKGSTKASRAPQADAAGELEEMSPALPKPQAFAKGGKVKKTPYYPDQSGREIPEGAADLPRDVKAAPIPEHIPDAVEPPPFTKGPEFSPGADGRPGPQITNVGESPADVPFSQSRAFGAADAQRGKAFSQTIGKAAPAAESAAEDLAAPAAEEGGLSAVEKAGLGALMRRYLPELAGAGVGGLVAQGMLASPEVGEADQDAYGTAAQNAYDKGQKMHPVNESTGPAFMAKFGSDADQAIAQDFLKHLKKNFPQK